MVVVLGSINMDLTFSLPRLPAEGETVLTRSVSEAMGGKGANQALAAARDGAATRFIGCVGDDTFGKRARATLTAGGVDVNGVSIVDDATGIAAIFVDGHGRNQIAVASGANAKVTAASLDIESLTSAQTLILQMEIPIPEIERAIAAATRARVRVILNLAPALPIAEEVLRQVSILIVNEHEAATLCDSLSVAAISHEDRARALTNRLGNTVIVTVGANGAIAVEADVIHHVPAMAVDVVDTTGAGDCFVGVLAGALDRGVPLNDAIRRATIAASLACTIVGAAPSFPTRAVIDAAVTGPAR